MKTNMTQKGFTLIELLVVIVIIGILATISVATFSGYFAKARDTERKTFAGAARTAITAESITGGTVDFCFGEASMALAEGVVDDFIIEQGIEAPQDGSRVYYVTETACAAGPVASDSFAIVACLEDDESVFSAGKHTPENTTCTAGVYAAGGGGEGVIAIDL